MTDRFERGLENLRRIDGEAGEKVVESLKDISPDLARYTIEYPFADIYARPGLGLREREIATIAALTAMGTAQPQLRSTSKPDSMSVLRRARSRKLSSR